MPSKIKSLSFLQTCDLVLIRKQLFKEKYANKHIVNYAINLLNKEVLELIFKLGYKPITVLTNLVYSSAVNIPYIII